MFKTKELPVATIEDVHREFENPYTKEQTVLLKDVNDILKNDTNANMIDMAALEARGFTNSATVTKFKTSRSLSKLVKLRDYYLTTYGYDFVTEKKIIEICKKYGLVRADVKDFIGEIPMENMQEIVNFSEVKPEDNRYHYGDKYGKETTFKQFQNGQSQIDKNNPYNSRFSYRNPITMVEDIEIVGTEDQFNTKGKILDKTTMEFVLPDPDPIVLYPVRQGFLVISKWGDEADINLHQ